jgi:hypothetical protein
MTIGELIEELRGYMPSLEVKIVKALKTKREFKDIVLIGTEQGPDNTRIVTIGVSK